MDRRGFLERLGVATAGAVASAATGGAAGAAIMPALDADRLFERRQTLEHTVDRNWIGA